MARGIMRQFKLQEISAVDRPAQAGARMAIIKRDGTIDRAVKVSKSAIHAIVSKLGMAGDAPEAVTFEQALAHQVNWDRYWKLNDALRESVESIARDEDVDGVAKRTMLAKTLEQYSAAVLIMFGDSGLAKGLTDLAQTDIVCDEMTKLGYRFSEKGDIEKTTGSDSMNLKALAKSLGLPETATEEEVFAAVSKANTERELFKGINALSTEHRAYYDQVEKAEDKAAFLAKTDAAERDAVMKAFPPKKKPAADDSDEDDMKKLQKRASAAGLVIMKQEDVDAERLRISKLEERHERAEFTKRAEPLKMIGKAEEIGDLLYRITKLDPKEGPILAKAVEDTFARNDGIIRKGAMFAEMGAGGGQTFSKAAAEVQAAAEAFLKTDDGKNLGIEAARAEVRKRNPELKKREAEERLADRKAA